MVWMLAVSWVSATVGSYLLGAFQSGTLVARFVGGINVRDHGSGNTGATNVLRTVGVAPGIGVLLLDMLKGAGAVLITAVFVDDGFLTGQNPLFVSDLAVQLPIAGLVAVLGHVFPFRRQGGRGVATALGAVAVIAPLVALVALLGVLVALLTRYVSLGSMVGIWVSGITCIGLVVAGNLGPEYLIFALPVMALTTYRHLANIRRLITGQEHRISFKKKTTKESSQVTKPHMRDEQ